MLQGLALTVTGSCFYTATATTMTHQCLHPACEPLLIGGVGMLMPMPRHSTMPCLQASAHRGYGDVDNNANHMTTTTMMTATAATTTTAMEMPTTTTVNGCPPALAPMRGSGGCFHLLFYYLHVCLPPHRPLLVRGFSLLLDLHLLYILMSV